jgi:hypothetical protein
MAKLYETFARGRQALEAWDQELARLIAHEEVASTNLLPFRN